MKTSRRIVRLSVAVALVAMPAMSHAQENSEPKKRVEGEKKRPPAKEQTTPPPRQQGDAPQQQRTRPAQVPEQPVQRSRDPRPPRETPVQPQHTEQPRTEQPRTEQPRYPRVNPQQPAAQPGNQPAAPQNRRPDDQPGRTFGRSPVLAAPRREPGVREPAMNDGRTFPAARTVTTRNGDVIHRNSAGQVTQVRTNNGTVVYHPPNGPRRIEMARPGGSVVMAGAP